MRDIGLEFNLSNINWKFASNCRWCTINYFVFPFAIITGILIDLPFYGWITGMIIWGIIAGLDISGIVEDKESVDKMYVFTKSSLKNAERD